MKIEINPDGIWYHGSNCVFTELRENSTVTPWRELAEAFSHQPSRLNYDDNGVISHNGKEKGYLYIIDEPVTVGVDIYQHPRTTMDPNAEFFNKKAIKGKDDMRVAINRINRYHICSSCTVCIWRR